MNRSKKYFSSNDGYREVFAPVPDVDSFFHVVMLPRLVKLRDNNGQAIQLRCPGQTTHD